MDEIVLLTGIFAVTYIARYPLLVIVGRVTLPDGVFRALQYVPVAVLVAIIMPEILLREGGLSLQPDNPYLIGAVVATFIAWRTRNLLATIVIGMAIFLLLRVLMG